MKICTIDGVSYCRAMINKAGRVPHGLVMLVGGKPMASGKPIDGILHVKFTQ